MNEREENKANIVKRLRDIADALEASEFIEVVLEMNNHMNETPRRSRYEPTGWNIYGQTWCLSTMPPIFDGDNDD